MTDWQARILEHLNCTNRYIVQRGAELLGIEGLTTNASQNTKMLKYYLYTGWIP
jgi:hypothetical protein